MPASFPTWPSGSDVSPGALGRETKSPCIPPSYLREDHIAESSLPLFFLLKKKKKKKKEKNYRVHARRKVGSPLRIVLRCRGVGARLEDLISG
jgi:hypothetical protein